MWGATVVCWSVLQNRRSTGKRSLLLPETEKGKDKKGKEHSKSQ